MKINFQVKQRIHHWQGYQVLRFSSARQGSQAFHRRGTGQATCGKSSGLIFIRRINKKFKKIVQLFIVHSQPARIFFLRQLKFLKFLEKKNLKFGNLYFAPNNVNKNSQVF